MSSIRLIVIELPPTPPAFAMIDTMIITTKPMYSVVAKGKRDLCLQVLLTQVFSSIQSLSEKQESSALDKTKRIRKSFKYIYKGI
jgi:hypothetical protein